MKPKTKQLLFSAAVIALCVSNANAADVWTPYGTVKQVQVVEHGGFIIMFSTPLPSPCPPEGLYVYPGQNSMTADGVKAALTVATTALVTGKKLTVMYTNSSPYCWGRYYALQN